MEVAHRTRRWLLTGLLLVVVLPPTAYWVSGRLLHISLRSGHEDCARSLLHIPGLAGARDRFGGTPLHGTHEQETIDLLLAKGADLEARDKDGQTPFARALFHNQREKAQILYDAGANIHVRDGWLYTPLHRATYANWHEMTVQLIADGAELNARTERGATPLDVHLYINDDDDLIALVRGAGGRYAEELDTQAATAPPATME